MDTIRAGELHCLIDLHLHLDGSLPLPCVRRLASMQDIPLPAEDEELHRLLAVGPDCRDLNEYLERFALPLSLLQTPESLTAAVEELQQTLMTQGVRYAEIRFAPQLHGERGMTQAEAVRAAAAGLGYHGFRAGLILCCMRGADNHEANLETVRVAAEYADRGVCAVDLAGAEALFKTADFATEFALAREKGLRFTIHAGEADGPESIRTALAFGAKRIGHGVRSAEDPALVRLLAEKQIPLELCPTSNLNTAMFVRLEDYPLPQLLAAGVRATVNTDNTTVSDTTLRREYQKLIDTFALTREQVRTLLRNAAMAAFTDEVTRGQLLAAIDAELT